MRYQIRYENSLTIIHDIDPSWEVIAKHFAKNGYDPLYVYKSGILSYIITFEDFTNQRINNSLKRSFINNYNNGLKRNDIEKTFLSDLDAERLVYLEDGKVVCEVNALIELPLQNSVSKNLMALRYVRFFHNEFENYLEQYKSILILSNIDVFEFWKSQFPSLNLHFAICIEDAYLIMKDKEVSVVFDFIYNKKIRKSMQLDLLNVVDLCKVLTKFALEKIKCLSEKRGVSLYFYKLPRFQDLTCLHTYEEDNFQNRKSIGQLIGNECYLEAFTRSEQEKMYLKQKKYHSSQRLDNGYCFVMDESSDCNLKVHNGIRLNEFDNEKRARGCNFYGPCTAYGFLVEDKLTVPSLVQRYAKENGINLQTFNRAGIHGDNELNSIMEALSVPVARGDAHIFLDVLEDLPNEMYPHFCLVKNWFNDKKSTGDVQLLDFPGHCNSDANKIMAQYIYDDVKDMCITTLSETEERYPLLEETFDPFELLPITHSSYIKQRRIIRTLERKRQTKGKIGAMIAPDNFEKECSISYVKQCIRKCDYLYVFFLNVNIESVEISRNIYDEISKMDHDKIHIIPLEHFFNVARYLDSNQCVEECFEQAVFTEKAFLKLIQEELQVNIRFCPDAKAFNRWNEVVSDASSSFQGEIIKIRL